MSNSPRQPIAIAQANCERWLPVIASPDYEVSDRGRVRWNPALPKRHRVTPGGFLKTWTDDQGYTRVVLRIDGVQKIKLVHVLVATAFLGPCPQGKEVNHKNGHDKSDCSVGNLEYVTHQENVDHSHATGLAVILRGEGHGNAVLNAPIVRVIRRCVFLGLRQRDIAAIFGIDRTTVTAINRRKNWGHVEHTGALA